MTARWDAENGIREERAARARMVGTDESFVRKVILVMAGLGVICLSFWITLIIIDTGADSRPSDVLLTNVPLTNEDGSPRNTRPSNVSDLLRAPVVPPFGAGWDGLEGMNAVVMGPGPTGGGNLALSLVATRDKHLHRIGLAFGGIPANRPIRALVWIKAPPNTHIRVDARDGQDSGHQAPHYGMAEFGVVPPQTFVSSGSVHAGIEPGPSNWAKISVEMPSSNGTFVIYFSLLGPQNTAEFSGSGEQMIFGGIQLTPG